MNQIIEVTNSEDFIKNWAFFATKVELDSFKERLIISLNAIYDGFEDRYINDTKSWKIACNGFMEQQLNFGYLRPFYQLKLLSNHPILWSYGSITSFTIHSPYNKITSLMGKLFLVHSEVCGNWIQFHKIFRDLPQILKTQSEQKFRVPTSLWEHFSKILNQYNIRYSVEDIQQGQCMSALFFSSADFSDDYNYGQPYVVAESFEII